MCDGLSDLSKVGDDLCYVLPHGLRHLHHTQGYGLNAQLTRVLVHQTQLQSADELEKRKLDHYGNRWNTAYKVLGMKDNYMTNCTSLLTFWMS